MAGLLLWAGPSKVEKIPDSRDPRPREISCEARFHQLSISQRAECQMVQSALVREWKWPGKHCSCRRQRQPLLSPLLLFCLFCRLFCSRPSSPPSVDSSGVAFMDFARISDQIDLLVTARQARDRWPRFHFGNICKHGKGARKGSRQTDGDTPTTWTSVS